MNQRVLARKQEIAAVERYQIRYNTATHMAATAGKITKYANALIDEALAICGSPYYKLSNRRWSKEALAYLALFG